MGCFKEFDIDITRPQAARSYSLVDHFFSLFDHSPLKQGNLAVQVHTRRQLRHIQLLFNISGTVRLVCDRSLESFDYPICIEKEVNFKLGNAHKELAIDLYMLEQQASTINIAQHIYDFVVLAVPMKKLHPQFQTEAKNQYND